MLSSNLLKYAVAAFSLFTTSTFALPQPEGAELQKRASTVKCDAISKYTTEWFVSNVCTKPAKKTCVFYTSGLSQQAIELANKPKSKYITIWHMWDRSLYNLLDKTDNPLRCIMKDAKQRRTYFENMSRAMATLCNGPEAMVMDQNYKNVYMKSIWGLVEFPRLNTASKAASQKVNTVTAINMLGDQSVNFWKRPGTKRDDDEDNADEDTSSVSDVEESIFERQEKRSKCSINKSVYTSAAKQTDKGGKYVVDW